MKVQSLLKHVILAGVLFVPFAHAAEMKIGFVNLERAINEVDEGIQAKANLKKEFDKKQAVLDKKQTDLKARLDEVEKQGAVLKPEAKQKKMAEVQKMGMEVQQLANTMQREMMEEQNKAMGDIMQKMNSTVAKMASDGDYTYILNKSEASILWGKPALDLTNEVIRNYNATNGKSGKSKT